MKINRGVNLVNSVISRIMAENEAKPDPFQNMMERERRAALKARADSDNLYEDYLLGKPFAVIDDDFDYSRYGLTANSSQDEWQAAYEKILDEMRDTITTGDLREKLKGLK